MATSFDWDELDFTMDFKPWQTTAERTGLIAEADLLTAISEIFPVPVLNGAVQSDGAGIAFPGFTQLFADAVHVERQAQNFLGSGTQSFDSLPLFEKYKLTVKYVTKKWGPGSGLPGAQEFNPDPVELLQHRWSIGGEFLTLRPADELTWLANASDPITDEVKTSKFIPTIEHQITWPYVLFPPFAAMRNCVGKVNSTLMTLQTGVIKVGALLFLGAELERQVLSNGARAWQVTYRFSEKLLSTDAGGHHGWNVFYNPTSNVFDVFFDPDDGSEGEFPYELVNMNSLFLPSQSG